MKNIAKYLLVGITTLGFLHSCEDYLDVNQDPNNPSSEVVQPEIVLAATQVYTYRTLSRDMNQLGNLMMNNWTRDVGVSNSSYYFNERTYNVTSEFYSAIWENLYLRTSNYTFIQNTQAEGYDYYKAIANIMKSFYFQYLVDLYGDLPYSEAHKRGDNLTPTYDDDMEVYRDLIVQIDEAIELIDNAPAGTINPGSNDVMLNGDMDMWRKFANTLKLRILLRESEKASSATYVSQQMATLNGAEFLGPNDNVFINPGFTAAQDKQNPFAALFLNINDAFVNNYSSTAATKYTITYLTNTNDARRNRIYDAASNGTYDGHTQGDILTPATNYPVSHIGPGLLIDSSQDGIVFTAAESLLLQAEAVQRGLLTGSAQDLYESGITESYKLLGLTAADASAYYSQTLPLVGWSGSAGNEIEAIINQKWIALNGINGAESWIEYTRTGFPSHVPISPVAIRPQRPVRLLYPSSEILGNTANVPQQDESEAFTNRVFWNE
ncbi:SusD/RagB family nutrient-binding outer membrane lipoprotein [Flavobacterium sp. NST-5]|uniref:SusD/RagB family nutrient-binding outer membrane lipoprotein n=1 Tax=Flavobacterium ichthyis TaxID=2698827 RepID=A0ABW9ZAB9_9FLAO|nr:SusD/RagB family nutrient-binding outer membrane lipoprotein [Flavobacterium ichthyis]NBL63748.1 SusD/RagB family nutrient-binding outer membrane lipoprotein [Flavobacterium ichthyis]